VFKVGDHELPQSFFEQCLLLSEEDRIKSLREFFNYDENYFQGEADAEELASIPDIEKWRKVFKREEEVKKLSE
jgi:hypothetical protein